MPRRSAAATPAAAKITARLPAEGQARHPRGRAGVAAAAASDEEALLAGCYRSALDLAAAHALASIAYPAISTGIYRFPADLAARIAVGTVASEIAAQPRGIARVVFCCFAPESAEHHKECVRGVGVGVLRLNLRLHIEPRNPVLQSRLRRRIDLQHLRIVPRHDVLARARELLQRLVALERVADANR